MSLRVLADESVDYRIVKALRYKVEEIIRSVFQLGGIYGCYVRL